jgi:integrase
MRYSHTSKTLTDSIVSGSPPAVVVERHPTHTLREWLARAGVSAGPVFRRVDRHGNVGDKAMAGASVALILKRAGGAAGMDRGALGAHGLRSGFATSMSRAGVDLRRIMNQTGHRSVAVAMRYVQEGERLRDDFTELARL